MRSILTFPLAALLAATPLAAQTFTDAKGFLWDFGPGGYVVNGPNDTFDGGNQLAVNGTAFAGVFRQREDGAFEFGSQTFGDVSVSRTVFPSKQPAALVYLETFQSNREEGEAVVRFSLESNMGGAPTLATTSGNAGGLASLVLAQSGSRSSVAYVFGKEGTKFLPREVVKSSSDQFSVRFPDLTLKPGQSRSVVYVLAQRAGAGEAKSLVDAQRLFPDAVTLADPQGQLDLVNASRQMTFDFGDLDLVPPGSTDRIEARAGTRATGEIATSDFVLDTAWGERPLKLREIVNAIASDNGEFQIVTTAGEILGGRLQPDRIRIKRDDGAEREVELSEVVRIVPRAAAAIDAEKPDTWFKFRQPLFQLRSGERIAGLPKSTSLSLHTSVGTLEVPLERIGKLEFDPKGGATAYKAKLTTLEGEKLSGILYGIIEVQGAGGLGVTIPARLLRVAYFAAPSAKEEKTLEADSRPRLRLSKGEFLLAALEAPPGGAYQFVTAFGPRPVPAESIARIEAHPELAGKSRVTLWDGSELSGVFQEEVLTFRLLGKNQSVPSVALPVYENPSALPSPAESAPYLELIQQLGDDKPEARQGAFDELAAAGPSIHGLLRRALKDAGPEAQISLGKLLSGETEKKEAEGKPEAESKEAEDASPPSPPKSTGPLPDLQGEATEKARALEALRNAQGELRRALEAKQPAP